MKNLENFGVQEMNTEEIKTIEGGFWELIIQRIVHKAMDYELRKTIEGYNKYNTL